MLLARNQVRVEAPRDRSICTKPSFPTRKSLRLRLHGSPRPDFPVKKIRMKLGRESIESIEFG